jgi:GH24 family phage-related lysozyme (muramidase)
MIGYGHLVHHVPIWGAASEAPFAGGITEPAATALLLEDAGYAEHAVQHLVTVPLSQPRHDGGRR